jgi:endo-1,4-beta-xylanase
VVWNNPDGPAAPGVEHHSFMSPSMDVEVGYNVYLPDGYEEGDARYPVIYFLHGAGGNENSDAGGFSERVQRLEEAGDIPPAICVFPNGGMTWYQDRPDEKIMGETLIVRELVPLIDQNYRTLADREGRVISGFSMGGGGAVRLALKYPDVFSAAGSWAAALNPRGGGPGLAPELETDHLHDIAGRVRLLMIVGDQDGTFEGHQPVIHNMEAAAFPFRYEVLEGVAHNLGRYHQETGDAMVRFLAEGF